MEDKVAEEVTPSEEATTVAKLVVRCLENEGVKYVFGIPGEENIHFIDALNSSSIRFILVHHEQAASFMAEMYSRVTGMAGICSATLGPGAINLLLGTADAHTDSVPLVAISAQVGLNRQYKETHQFVDLVSMFKPVTKWAAEIKVPSAVPEMVRKTLKKCRYHQVFSHCFDRKCMIVLPLRRRSLGPRRYWRKQSLLLCLQVMGLHEITLRMH